MKKKTITKMGLFNSKKAALKDAAQRRKSANNDIQPNFTTFYKVERTKKPKNPKKPSYYVVKTSRRKSNSSKIKARKKIRGF